jgi:hypothetical protein
MHYLAGKSGQHLARAVVVPKGRNAPPTKISVLSFIHHDRKLHIFDEVVNWTIAASAGEFFFYQQLQIFVMVFRFIFRKVTLDHTDSGSHEDRDETAGCGLVWDFFTKDGIPVLE